MACKIEYILNKIFSERGEGLAFVNKNNIDKVVDKDLLTAYIKDRIQDNIAMSSLDSLVQLRDGTKAAPIKVEKGEVITISAKDVVIRSMKSAGDAIVMMAKNSVSTKSPRGTSNNWYNPFYNYGSKQEQEAYYNWLNSGVIPAFFKGDTKDLAALRVSQLDYILEFSNAIGNGTPIKIYQHMKGNFSKKTGKYYQKRKKGEKTSALDFSDITDVIIQIANEKYPVTETTGTPEFDKLPVYTADQKTMTYAGIGSRKTPPGILKRMTEIAERLKKEGYTLQTGKLSGSKEEGADKAFSDGTDKKVLFSPDGITIGSIEWKVVKEIHPNFAALTKKGTYGAKLMARNTNQIFGAKLDTPVDFVLFYANETSNPDRPEGGTGQAVELARKKGIPTINMAEAGWEEKFEEVLSSTSTTSNTTSDGPKSPENAEPSVFQKFLSDSIVGALNIESMNPYEAAGAIIVNILAPGKGFVQGYHMFSEGISNIKLLNMTSKVKQILGSNTENTTVKALLSYKNAIERKNSSEQNEVLKEHYAAILTTIAEVLKSSDGVSSKTKIKDIQDVLTEKYIEKVVTPSSETASLIHELGHAAYEGFITDALYDKSHKAHQRAVALNELFIEAKNTYLNEAGKESKDKVFGNVSNNYWTTDLHEFISEVISNRELFEALHKVKRNASSKRTIGSDIQRLLSSLLNMFSSKMSAGTDNSIASDVLTILYQESESIKSDGKGSIEENLSKIVETLQEIKGCK